MKRFPDIPEMILLALLLLSTTACNTNRPSAEYEALADHLEESHASSMMIVVGGEVVFEWGNTRKKHLVHSIRKALMNSLYGIAIEKGQIDTSTTIRELGIDDIDPALSENEKNARIADLLKSRSGIYHPAAAVSRGMLGGMPDRDAYAPGEHYHYNNWDFNVLGSILERKTGKSIYELFREEIALPLGMKDYQGRFSIIDGEKEGVDIPDTDGFYQFENSKSLYPACHFRLSARDLARYGQLYLNHGSWRGREVVPGDWIEASTRPISVYDTKHGLAYGMLWRVVIPGEDTERNSFFHTGAGIHMLGIYPDLDMVVVHRVDTENRDDYRVSDFYRMLELLFSLQPD